ncbi:AAA family ATPase [uncultured Bacteroides sp.]|uniref:ATP-binding protein n=1 Tax=uncultured Bacteroides sp. TaxID=162156 RepID=UPI0025D084C3|nr:AAA family ATPase [uncultured Bacteroides sp.]
MATDRIFKRKIYDRMLKWKAESNGNTALLIKGARRVGKSTIAEEFARKEYESYILIDFSIADKSVKELFNQLSDLNFFFLRLQSLFNTSLHQRKSVIIFDEVQLYPPARQAIKHLVKDHRYDYIETGSLLSIKKNVKGILIPSEETRISMYPMDYEEFLWAVNKAPTFELIQYSFNNLKSMGDAVNRELMKDFRLYMLIGGMPQAVNEYLNSNDFSTVDAIKRNILELYMDDFRKIDPTGKASRLFLSIPSELSRNTMRYKIGSIIENATASRLGELLMDMADSMTVNFAYHANDPSVGLPLHADYDCFKMFLNDTGLFVTLAFMDKDYTDNDIYRKLLSDKLSTDLGYVYENVIAQILKSSGNELFYYTFKEKVEKVNAEDNPVVRNYEVDFLLSRKDKICPIEVKSSGYNSHKSLDKFQEKYSSRIKNRYLLYTKDVRKDKDIICLPVYMVGLL